jgi:hypothetical protein
MPPRDPLHNFRSNDHLLELACGIERTTTATTAAILKNFRNACRSEHLRDWEIDTWNMSWLKVSTRIQSSNPAPRIDVCDKTHMDDWV